MLEAELRPEQITRGEHALVDAIAAGDRHAFEKLYRQYDRRVFQYISADGAYVIQLPAVAPTVLSQRLRVLREQPGLVERIENATP